MFYTLTKYLTSDYFRENEFTKAFLELVDEVIFCCYMESREMLSQLSFETMDDNYFLTFQDFFLNGLSSFDIKNLDRNVLSEWFSLLHVRGELSDLSKLLKFGGSLTTIQTNNKLTLYNNADVPETITNIGVDGIIYAVTDENVNLTEDFFINQQTPAGYKFNLIRQPAPFDLVSSDSIDYLLEKNNNIFVIDYGSIDLTKEKSSEFEFYRRRQFDQTYSFKQLYQSGYTINELSKFHKKGDFFFGFDIELIEPDSEIIPMGGLISDDNDILFEYPYGAPVSIGNYNYSVGNLKNIVIEDGGIVNIGNYNYSVGVLYGFIIEDGGFVKEWEPPIQGVPMGGMMSETSSSTYYLPTELVYDFSVDNITLSGFMRRTTDDIIAFGNDQTDPESIVINDNDVVIPLWEFDEPITDKQKLYGITRLEGTGTGTIPSPAPALPTVSMSYTYPNSIWNYSVNIGAGSSNVLRDQNGNALSYDSTKSYSALHYYISTSDSTGIIATDVSIGASGSFLAIFNNGSSQITVQSVNVATCSDSTATVITVYNSSNVAYNAFKYTSDGTDYYYVLDGTQTDWTDDLSSIGYQLYQEITLYIPGGSSRNYYNQGGITSSYSGSPDGGYTTTLYTDSSLSQSYSYDVTKQYVSGYYSSQTGEWVESDIQSVSDMPDSVVSESPTTGRLIINYNNSGSAYLWFVSNFYSNQTYSVFANNPVSFKFRLYPFS